jgi:hypothetical protein
VIGLGYVILEDMVIISFLKVGQLIIKIELT